MWKRRSHILAPLTAITSAKSTWKWGAEQEESYNTIKRVIAQEVLLAYPDFNVPFDVHTDASDLQLGAVISQNGRPIAFYSRKLNKSQRNYTTTERELLAIVETLKEFQNILLGHDIKVHTDHKNLTYKNFNTTRVMRWRLILEEFGPQFQYIKGSKNVVADAISRLSTEEEQTKSSEELFSLAQTMSNLPTEDYQPDKEPTMASLAQLYANEPSDLPEDAVPITYKTIFRHQQLDKELRNLARKNGGYTIKPFHGASKTRHFI